MNIGWVVAIGLAAAVVVVGSKAVVGYDGIVMVMAAAIQSFEGWSAGSVSYRNNNPGNLKYANQKDALGCDAAGFAVFPTYEAGWAALCTQLTLAFTGASHVYSPDDTLGEFFSKYSEGDSSSYANYVADKLGVTAGTRLRDIAHA